MQPLLAADVKLCVDRKVKHGQNYLRSFRARIAAETHLATFFRFFDEQCP